MYSIWFASLLNGSVAANVDAGSSRWFPYPSFGWHNLSVSTKVKKTNCGDHPFSALALNIQNGLYSKCERIYLPLEEPTPLERWQDLSSDSCKVIVLHQVWLAHSITCQIALLLRRPIGKRSIQKSYLCRGMAAGCFLYELVLCGSQEPLM